MGFSKTPDQALNARHERAPLKKIALQLLQEQREVETLVTDAIEVKLADARNETDCLRVEVDYLKGCVKKLERLSPHNETVDLLGLTMATRALGLLSLLGLMVLAAWLMVRSRQVNSTKRKAELYEPF